MKLQRIVLALVMAILLSLPAFPGGAYVYCGYHDRTFSMTAYHWNSEFWVDMLVDEANKWNAVHSVLSIGRIRRSTVPVGNDGRSVISWIGESDLNSNYGLSWSGTVGWTITWYSGGGCTRITEADIFFNPGITLFTAQTRVPYSLGYREIALHELGHVVTQDHENRTLAVMTSGQAVSDVLYTSDKVGWLRSADFRFSVTDRRDMGVFPLRNAGANKTYSTLSPTTVSAGNNVTIRDFTVQNLSSSLAVTNPSFKVFLENTATGASTEIGWFSWGQFCAYCEWSGNLTYRVPTTVGAGTYRLVAIFQGSDSDNSNDRAVFGTLQVR